MRQAYLLFRARMTLMAKRIENRERRYCWLKRSEGDRVVLVQVLNWQ